MRSLGGSTPLNPNTGTAHVVAVKSAYHPAPNPSGPVIVGRGGLPPAARSGSFTYQTKIVPNRPAPKTPGTRNPNNPWTQASNQLNGKTASIQKQLAAKGYHVAQDGVMGPETRSAMQAARSGMNSSRWNHAYHGIAPSASGSSGGGQTGGKSGGSGGLGAGSGAHGGKTGGGSSSGSPLNAKADAYAQALTNQQYGPQLDQLNYQLAQGKAQEAQNVANIGQWYDQVGNTAQQAAGNVQSHDAQQQQDFAQIAANLAAAFGGGANAGSGQAGDAAQIMAGQLAGQAQADNSFNQDMVPILATQGAEAKTAEQTYGNQLASSLADKIAQATAAKGSALTVNEFNALNALTQRQAAQANIAATQHMSGLDKALKRAQLTSQQIQNAADKLTLQQMMHHTKAGKSFDWSQVDVPGVTDRLTNIVSDKRGTFAVDPRRAISQIQNEATAMFGRGVSDGRVQTLMENVIARLFGRSKQANSAAVRGWKYTNGRIIDPSGRTVFTFRHLGPHHQ